MRSDNFPPIFPARNLAAFESPQQIKPGIGRGNDRNPRGGSENTFTSQVPLVGNPQRATTKGDVAKVSNNQAFAFVQSSTVDVPTAAGGAKFLDQPVTKRNFLGFRNVSATANIFIDFNSQASANSWLRLVPGAFVLFDTVVPQDDLWAFADAVGGQLVYAVSTFNPDSE